MLDTVRDIIIEVGFKFMSTLIKSIFRKGNAKAFIELMNKKETEFTFKARTALESFKMFSLGKYTLICTVIGFLFIFLIPDVVNSTVVWFISRNFNLHEKLLQVCLNVYFVIMYCLVIIVHLLLALRIYINSNESSPILSDIAKVGKVAHYINAITFLIDFTYILPYSLEVVYSKQAIYMDFYIVLPIIVTLYIIAVYVKTDTVLFSGTAKNDGKFVEYTSSQEGIVFIKKRDGSNVRLNLFESKIIITKDNNILSMDPLQLFVMKDIEYIDVCGKCKIEFDVSCNKWTRKEYMNE